MYQKHQATFLAMYYVSKITFTNVTTNENICYNNTPSVSTINSSAPLLPPNKYEVLLEDSDSSQV